MCQSFDLCFLRSDFVVVQIWAWWYKLYILLVYDIHPGLRSLTEIPVSCVKTTCKFCCEYDSKCVALGHFFFSETRVKFVFLENLKQLYVLDCYFHFENFGTNVWLILTKVLSQFWIYSVVWPDVGIIYRSRNQ